MALTNTPGYPQAIDTVKTQYLPADGTAGKTIFTAGTNGSKVKGIIVTQSDVIRSVGLIIKNGATTWTMLVKNLPATGGQASNTPSINLLGFIVGLPLDSDQQPFMILGSGDSLLMSNSVTLNTGKSINITVIAVDY